MTYFHWLGHDHHAAKREQLEREQRAIDEARAIAANCPVLADDDDG